jgi:hypothetical protein
LERWEKEAIIELHRKNPLEGYRRLTFMMLDADIVAAARQACGEYWEKPDCYRSGRASRRRRARASSTRCRQNVFADFHRTRVDTGQLVGAELAEEGRVVLQNHYAVGHGVSSWQFGQGHRAGLRIETPSFFAPCPVYQSEPSGASAGS